MSQDNNIDKNKLVDPRSKITVGMHNEDNMTETQEIIKEKRIPKEITEEVGKEILRLRNEGGLGIIPISKVLKISHERVRKFVNDMGFANTSPPIPPSTYITPTEKICCDCKELKLICEFREYRTKNTLRYRTECKNCEKEQAKEYRSNNKDKAKEYRSNSKDKAKEYRSNNKEKIKEYEKEYRSNNKDKRNKRDNNRKDKDPEYKLRRHVSSLIRLALKSNSSNKNGHSIMDFLPYTIKELREHLEKQFLEPQNMIDGKPIYSWKNWGKYIASEWNDNDPTTYKWQLDHISPQSDFPFISMQSDNFQKCWALENLRVYSAKQNCLDGVSQIRHQKNKKA